MFSNIVKRNRNTISKLNVNQSPKFNNISKVTQDVGINSLGIINPSIIHHNLNYDELCKHEVKNNEGIIMKTKYGDTFAVDTGKFTGRSPKDKWIVKNINGEK